MSVTTLKSVHSIYQILSVSQECLVILDNVVLNLFKITIVVGAVASKVNELVAEMSVQMDAQPFVVCAIVVNKKLGSHLGVEKCAVEGIFLSLN